MTILKGTSYITPKTGIRMQFQYTCDECNQKVDYAVSIGYLGHETSSAVICKNCLNSALAMITEAERSHQE